MRRQLHAQRRQVRRRQGPFQRSRTQLRVSKALIQRKAVDQRQAEAVSQQEARRARHPHGAIARVEHVRPGSLPFVRLGFAQLRHHCMGACRLLTQHQRRLGDHREEECEQQLHGNAT